MAKKTKMTRDDIFKRSGWIVCPLCDEPVCVGRFNCPIIEEWVEKKMKEFAEAIDKKIEDAILG